MNFIRNVLALCVLLANTAAQMVSSGGYTFDVDVVNEQYRRVYNARASVMVSGTTAWVEARANGYREGRTSVFLNQSQKHVRVQVRLSEPSTWVRVRSKAGKELQASVNQNQFMAISADRYTLEVNLREQGYSKFTYRDVEVRVNHLWAFAPRIQVYGTEGAMRVQIEVRRDDMREFSNQIEVEIPSDAELAPARRKRVQALSFELLSGELDEATRTQKLEELRELRLLMQ